MTPSRPVNTTNLDDDWDNLQDGRRQQHQIQRGQEVNDLSDVMANFRPCKKSFSFWFVSSFVVRIRYYLLR